MDEYLDILLDIENKIGELQEVCTGIDEKVNTMQKTCNQSLGEISRTVKNILNEEKISPRAKTISRIEASVGNEQLILERLKFLETRIDNISLAVNTILNPTPTPGKNNSSPSLHRERARSVVAARTDSSELLSEL